MHELLLVQRLQISSCGPYLFTRLDLGEQLKRSDHLRVLGQFRLRSVVEQALLQLENVLLLDEELIVKILQLRLHRFDLALRVCELNCLQNVKILNGELRHKLMVALLQKLRLLSLDHLGELLLDCLLVQLELVDDGGLIRHFPNV